MITIDPIKRPSKPSSSVNTEEIMKEVDLKISDLIGGSPETLDTLKELADALKDNSDIIEVLNENINSKLSKAEAEENYAIKTEIPTKVSQLENDANYILDDVVSDGVYVVDANGKLIDYNEADESCIGVALVAGEHKFMIAKANATDGTNTTLYYDYDKGDLSLTNYSTADGTNSYGYLGTELSDDFTTWTKGALSDFNGKTNTQVIAASSSNARDMCKVLETFNAGSDNQGHSDWYVPACGQLALMYLAKTDINAALAKIGGTALESDTYWSSSEYDAGNNWVMDFNDGYVDYGGKHYDCRVRFVRDIEIKGLKQRITDLESKTAEIENQLSNVYTKSEVDAKILELQTLINNHINGTSQVSELDA